MQREGAVPDSFVQKKCHAHRIFGLNKALSTKHLELLVRPGGAKKCLWTLQPDCKQVIFSTTKLQPTAPRSTFSLNFVPVFVFDHFAGLALPAPHSGWSTPMPHRSLFYLQLPPPCSPLASRFSLLGSCRAPLQVLHYFLDARAFFKCTHRN